MVGFPKGGVVVSASRDGSVRLWTGDATGGEWSSQIMFQGDKYVNSVAWLAESDEGPQVVCGSQDSKIRVVDVAKPMEVTAELAGHGANVCSLHVLRNTIASGSWDATARVWDGTRLVHTLKGHTASVWAVLVLSEHRVLTGSADRTIRLWEDGRHVRSYEGHTDAVRGLCKVTDDTFASCSNDGTVRVWSLEGRQLAELTGHSSFVYSVALLPGGRLVSCGEDRSVRVWNVDTGASEQVITLPAVSVWSVAASADMNGDFAVGTSDRTVRVFSASPDRWASQAQLDELAADVAGSGLGRDQVGTVSESQLSDPAVLDAPGKSEGQVVMVRNAFGRVEAHQWTTGQWAKIGEVVGSAGSSAAKQTYDGREYDYVFDVDIEDGKPPLKLPYNVTDNPYTAAQQFIDRHQLPATYLDEVARFIIKNSEGVDLSAGPADTQYGSRYVPGGATTTTSTAPSAPTPPTKVLPHRSYVQLVSFEPEPLLKALRKSNDAQPVLSESELAQVASQLDALTPDAADDLFQLVQRLASEWPIAALLPVFDILRVIVPLLSNPGSVALVQLVFSGLDPAVPKHALLATRALVNLLSVDKGRKLAGQPQVAQQAFDVLAALVRAQPRPDKARDLAIASLVLNYAVANTVPAADVAAVDALVAHMATSEAVYRALLGLGTFAAHGKRPKSTALAKLRSTAEALNEPRFSELLADMQAVGL